LGSADPSAGRTVASTADTEGLTAPGAPAERALPELAAIGGPGADGVGAQRSDAEVLVSLVPLERTVHDLLAARGEVWDLTVDPQRTRLAFTWQPEPKGRRSIATLALDGTSTIRPAGRDRGDERRPRFDPSGRRLLFEATFPLSVMERMLVIPGLSPPVR
jgi:hypothetical protein